MSLKVLNITPRLGYLTLFVVFATGFFVFSACRGSVVDHTQNENLGQNTETTALDTTSGAQSGHIEMEEEGEHSSLTDSDVNSSDSDIDSMGHTGEDTDVVTENENTSDVNSSDSDIDSMGHTGEDTEVTTVNNTDTTPTTPSPSTPDPVTPVTETENTEVTTDNGTDNTDTTPSTPDPVTPVTENENTEVTTDNGTDNTDTTPSTPDPITPVTETENTEVTTVNNTDNTDTTPPPTTPPPTTPTPVTETENTCNANGSAFDTTNVASINIGDTAADFTLPVVGEDCGFKLSDQYGKSKQVVFFHRGLWCSQCLQQLSVIQDGRKQISDAGATIVAVSPEKYAGAPDAYINSLESRASSYSFPSLVSGDLSNSDDLFGLYTGHYSGHPRAVVIVDESGMVTDRIISQQYYVDPHITISQIVAALNS